MSVIMNIWLYLTIKTIFQAYVFCKFKADSISSQIFFYKMRDCFLFSIFSCRRKIVYLNINRFAIPFYIFPIHFSLVLEAERNVNTLFPLSTQGDGWLYNMVNKQTKCFWLINDLFSQQSCHVKILHTDETQWRIYLVTCNVIESLAKSYRRSWFQIANT